MKNKSQSPLLYKETDFTYLFIYLMEGLLWFTYKSSLFFFFSFVYHMAATARCQQLIYKIIERAENIGRYVGNLSLMCSGAGCKKKIKERTE